MKRNRNIDSLCRSRGLAVECPDSSLQRRLRMLGQGLSSSFIEGFKALLSFVGVQKLGGLQKLLVKNGNNPQIEKAHALSQCLAAF